MLKIGLPRAPIPHLLLVQGMQEQRQRYDASVQPDTEIVDERQALSLPEWRQDPPKVNQDVLQQWRWILTTRVSLPRPQGIKHTFFLVHAVPIAMRFLRSSQAYLHRSVRTCTRLILPPLHRPLEAIAPCVWRAPMLVDPIDPFTHSLRDNYSPVLPMPYG